MHVQVYMPQVLKSCTDISFNNLKIMEGGLIACLLSTRKVKKNAGMSNTKLASENSRHLAMLPLVSPPNDVSEMSAEIPY